MKLSIIGLGKLGACMAVLFANRGFDVIGIDSNENLVNSLNKGECPIKETSLPQLLDTCKNKFWATTDLSEVSKTDATFIIIPTPSMKSGAFSNEYIMKVVYGISKSLAKKKGYHLVVITSTVMPGTCEKVVAPALEITTGRKIGETLGLCYSPEFIALGSVIKGMSEPDVVLIGESDKRAGDMLEEIYRKQCLNQPPFCRMSWWNAELSKIALNVFITTKISLANTFARVCEKIPNGNIEDVVNFLGYDSRIGHKFMASGLGFGGTCFPRDNRAFIKMAKDLQAQCLIQEAVDKFNDGHCGQIALDICDMLTIKQNKQAVSFLGITYKPNTPVVEESRAMKIIKILQDLKTIEIKIYDPMGMPEARKELAGVTWCQSVKECLQDSDLVVIGTAWDEFKCLIPESLGGMRRPAVFDAWRILDRSKFLKAGIPYKAVGVNG